MRNQTRMVVRDLEKFVENVVIRVVTNVTEELVEVNPIDTGWSRHNWIPALSSVDTPSGSKLNVGAAEGAQAAGLALVQATYKFPNVVFISNNVPYIGILNSPLTNSRQAPPGFVERSIVLGIRSVT